MFRLPAALTAVGVLTVVTFGQPMPAPDDVPVMNGDWTLSSGEVGGQKLPEAFVKSVTLTLKDGRYTLKSAGPDDTGTVRLDPVKTPKELNVTGVDGPNKGKTFPCIFKLDGDTLTVCYDLAGKARPAEFKSPPGTMHFLAVYKRKKG